MPDYRRAFQPGGTFFLTLVTERRARILMTDGARAMLRRAFEATRTCLPFQIPAIVLLPNHLHLLMALPEGDSDYSKRMGRIKKAFTEAWLAGRGLEQPVSRSRRRNRRRGVWQRRFWEHMIRDDADFIRHCDYIHYNPVRHGLVACPRAWPYSSFHRFVRQDVYDPNWQCVCETVRPTPPDFKDISETAME